SVDDEVLQRSGGRAAVPPGRTRPVSQGESASDGGACCWPGVPESGWGAASAPQLASALLGPGGEGGGDREGDIARHASHLRELPGRTCTRFDQGLSVEKV